MLTEVQRQELDHNGPNRKHHGPHNWSELLLAVVLLGVSVARRQGDKRDHDTL